MKHSIIITLSVVSVLLAASCERIDHAQDLTVTYYPVFSLTGGDTYPHQVGTAWADPGFTATLNGEDIVSDVKIDDQVDGATSGVYTVTYSYTNKDGFTGSAVRTVVVYDIANASSVDISGEYKTTHLVDNGRASGTRDWNEFLGHFNYALTITEGPAKGLFYIPDLYCGFYWKFYNGGYGSAYAYKAFVLLNADNTISVLNLDEMDPWGDPMYLTEGEPTCYDPVSGDVIVSFNFGSAAKYTCTYSR